MNWKNPWRDFLELLQKILVVTIFTIYFVALFYFFR